MNVSSASAEYGFIRSRPVILPASTDSLTHAVLARAILANRSGRVMMRTPHNSRGHIRQGQSAMKSSQPVFPKVVSLFASRLGWFGIVGGDGVVTRLTFGHATRTEAIASLRSAFEEEAAIENWHPQLRARLERFAQGEKQNFSDIEVVETESTPFASRVIQAVRKTTPGQTLSYAEVAEASGSPRAARAVGNIMARNPIPIIIPCHRVTASGGLGGYSAWRGLDTKQRLLDLEAGTKTPARERGSRRRATI
jgi:methylated-DNA-[protein]-cysteine S-methyltransferase